MMLIDDQRADLRRRHRSAARSARRWSKSAPRANPSGGTAARAQMLGKFGPVNVSAEALLANDFHLQGGRAAEPARGARWRSTRRSSSAGRSLPAHADVHLTDRRDGIEPARRRGAAVGQFRPLQPRDRRSLPKAISARRARRRPASSTSALIGSGHIGDVRLRGSTDFDVSPQRAVPHARSCRLIGRRPKMSIGRARSPTIGQAIAAARGSRHIRRLDTMAIALTGEAATDGSVAFGVNLNFSLDPRHGLSLSRRPLAQAGAVHATVYRDLNDNGVRDPSEPLEKGALVTTGTTLAERPTDAKGSVTDRRPHRLSRRSRSGSTQTSLDDPMLVPKKALQVVVPRPGVPAEVADRPGRRRRHRRRDRQERRARLRRARPRAGRRRRARSSPPRAPISTASSCSSASLRQLYGPGRASVGGGGEDRRRPRRARVTVTRGQSRSSGSARSTSRPLPVIASAGRRRDALTHRHRSSLLRSSRSRTCPSMMVRSRKLELPRPFGHSDLNAARLPVPPRPHVMR